MRLIQISDTHISTTHRHFVNNTDRVQADLQETKPDLIVHTGDVSMDGAAHRHDLEQARRWNLALPAEVFSIPGNHDVGVAVLDSGVQRHDDIGYWDQWEVVNGSVTRSSDVARPCFISL